MIAGADANVTCQLVYSCVSEILSVICARTVYPFMPFGFYRVFYSKTCVSEKPKFGFMLNKCLCLCLCL